MAEILVAGKPQSFTMSKKKFDEKINNAIEYLRNKTLIDSSVQVVVEDIILMLVCIESGRLKVVKE